MKATWFIIACVCSLIIANTASSEVNQEQADLRFDEHIRPLLSEYCFACHGPDSSSREADLRLDTREGAMASSAIVPGDASQSELVARITSDDPDILMPPPDFDKRLDSDEKQLLARWIDAGARWESHWAFIPPQKVELPKSNDVDNWARNAIDHFVLEKLYELGLKPNEEADIHRLARRAALDITGLPPTDEMFAALVSETDEGAYAQYVDRLLGSQHAGEHRARYWLDAARYGDTHGMHVDNYREIWPYRDWVIRAFNTNMPFNQFVVEQIAGDLLPASTLDQHVATGFNRCNITTSEGGAIPEEVNVLYMVDRVETTATVFMGLTAGCAVCHDHKYDPITQREFYQLGAFFNNTTQPAMDGNQKDTPPVVVLPNADFQDEWYTIQARRKALRAELRQWSSATSHWWASRATDIDHPIASDKLVLWLPLTEGEDPDLDLPASSRWADDHPAGHRGVRFDEKNGDLSVDFPQIRSDQPLTVSFWFRTPDRLVGTNVFEQTQKTEDGKTVGWKITSNTAGALTFQLLDTNGNSISGNLPDNDALRPRSWQHVCVRYSGGQANSSISILVDGRPISLRNATEAHVEATELADTRLRIAQSLPTAGLSDVRIYQRWVSDHEARLLARDGDVRRLIASSGSWDELDAQSQKLVTDFHKQTVDVDYRSRERELSATTTRRDYIYSRSTTTLVMQERPTQPRAWVLERGEYTKPIEEVSPGVPSVLPPMTDGAPANRLGLAQWLVRPDHPLTARVTVNRLWQSLFGVGLVKTSEDFGVMGQRPTHPELLDWLAVEFVESGWDVNHILRLIVTSATYRQSSVVTTEKVGKDPDNRFLARGPRLRLDAEVLRDQALAVCGLLRPTVGGPSVKPYQPSGLWNVVAITGSNTRVFERDSGDALYRRSIYTFWKRTSPPPSMAGFNAPTREQCTVRRERTNTPLQALVLMNDPQFVESARRLAQNALNESSDDRQRVVWMLDTILRHPSHELDIATLASAASAFRATFQASPAAAKELIHVGDSTPDATLDPAELAAWTMVANTIMNRDDFINK